MNKVIIMVAAAAVFVTVSLPAQAQRFTRDTTSADNPVVTDNVTKLMWQGCAAGLSGEACGTGTATKYTWKDALAYCEGLDWAGRNDWRLPNKTELMSIADDRESDQAIDSTAFPATPSDWFWSSSSYANFTSIAWYVYFDNGSVSASGKDGTSNARCVCSSP